MSLYQKLAVSLLVVFVLIIGTFFCVSRSLEAISRDKAEQELHKDLAAHLVHDNPLLSDGAHDKAALENLFHSMMILGPNFEFYVLDTKGNVLTYSAKPGEVIRDKIDLAPVKSMVTESMSYPIYAEDPRTEKQKIFSAAPIVKDGKTRGYLFVIIGGKIYDSIFNNVRNNDEVQFIGTITLASILFLLFSLLVIIRIFVKPLKNLTAQVREVRRSDSASLPLVDEAKSGQEVNELSTAFNQLISQVNEQIEKLSSIDNERRELLAHLSHDLRTPLSSLQGFLETIQLKDCSTNQEEFKVYVERSLKSAQSLKGFVDQIFELAHLESGQVNLSQEKFPIAELLYDMVDKFSVEAEKKEIDIQVKLDNESLLVSADIAKLERVLTNLMENALRHTAPFGSITIQATFDKKSQEIELAVKDNGTGIDQEELPYLFDPRYRGNNAIEDGKRHIGLGLTITRKLVSLMGSEIKAGNNEKGGAKFFFSLPVLASS